MTRAPSRARPVIVAGTGRLAGVGDDRRVHWWAWTPEEPMVRVCDGVEATDVELYARDKHGTLPGCEDCTKGAR